MNEQNAKNYLSELVKEWGYYDSFVEYQATQNIDGAFTAHIHLEFPNGLLLSATGTGARKKEAEKAAAEDMLQVIKSEYPNFLIDWQELFIQAQAGDALVKLAAYVNPKLDTPEKKSQWLQDNETDAFFVDLFDKLYAQGDKRVALFGQNLGKKRKATFIEALIWQEYHQQFLGAPQREILEKILNFAAF